MQELQHGEPAEARVHWDRDQHRVQCRGRTSASGAPWPFLSNPTWAAQALNPEKNWLQAKSASTQSPGWSCARVFVTASHGHVGCYFARRAAATLWYLRRCFDLVIALSLSPLRVRGMCCRLSWNERTSRRLSNENWKHFCMTIIILIIFFDPLTVVFSDSVIRLQCTVGGTP
jgi:hypothetical protein